MIGRNIPAFVVQENLQELMDIALKQDNIEVLFKIAFIAEDLGLLEITQRNAEDNPTMITWLEL